MTRSCAGGGPVSEDLREALIRVALAASRADSSGPSVVLTAGQCAAVFAELDRLRAAAEERDAALSRLDAAERSLSTLVRNAEDMARRAASLASGGLGNALRAEYEKCRAERDRLAEQVQRVRDLLTGGPYNRAEWVTPSSVLSVLDRVVSS
jgi:hypothetical protein